ncbi:MAG TPA: penicillin-binding transpeptidase domain-containing protein, partial [Acidimicrobiales bacterium]
PVADLLHAVNDPKYTPYMPAPVAKDVDINKILYIKEHQIDFRGVGVQSVAVRDYPNGIVAANIIGYVTEINDKELATLKSQGYQPGNEIGKTGIEATYESALRGQPGVEKIAVDARGRPLSVVSYQPPVAGHDVQLSIDLDIQQKAEQSLAEGLQAARQSVDQGSSKTFAAPGGSVVVEDPRDGSVLALATNPTYNPADFVGGISLPKYQQYLHDPLTPLNDRSLQGLYAPGSNFKLVTATAGLQAGIISPDAIFNDTGSYTVGPVTFYGNNKVALGPVNLAQAITRSSDPYFYNVGAQFWYGRAHFGDDGIQNVARSFGFGKPTGIDLPNESPGKIPDLASRRAEHAANPKAFPEGGWYAGDNTILAIGQGEIVVTPLQLADAYATFANGGTLWRPRVASRVLSRDGSVVQTFAPVAVGHVALPNRDVMLAGFEGAVAGPSGTAYGAFAGFPLDQLQVAGKTGTAQVTGKQPTSVFSSFAPANAPQYVVTAVLEQSGYGATAAAPVVRHVYDLILGHPPGPLSLGSGRD